MAPLGALLGLALTGVLAAGVDVDDPVDCMNRLKTIIWIQNGLYTVLCLLVLIFQRQKPDNPPSKLAIQTEKMPQRALCTDFGKILSNRDSVLNMSIFIIIWGGYITLGNVLTPLFDS